MSFETVLTKLTVERRDGNKAQCKCPAHDDSQASLSVTEKPDGTVLLHCHAGCDKGDILRAADLTFSDLYPAPNGSPSNKYPEWLKDKPTETNGHPKAVSEKRAIKEVYPYTDEHGKELFQCVRMEPKDFRQRRKENGHWVYNLDGVRRVLYGLPMIIQAVQSGRPVFVVEGEKDVQNLEAKGIDATTNPMGAGKWRPEYSEFLKGAEVVILPDNDEPGRKHAKQVAESLHGAAKSVKVLELPGLPEKGDVSDWIAGGGTAEDLRRLASEAPEYAPVAEPDKPDKPGTTDADNYAPPAVAKIETYLKDHYEFRLNEVSQRIEFKRKDEGAFRTLGEYELNSIDRELLHKRIASRNLSRLLSSDFVLVYNPFKSYLDGLPAWDGVSDHITKFADTITIKEDHQELWHTYFKKWLVAMVASLVRDDIVNHVMLVLIGAQGAGKTTWADNILPDELSVYRFTGNVNPTDKDTRAMLSDKALINLDEFETMSRHEIGLLKSMLTLSTVTMRRPYGRVSEDSPRRASFVASINDIQFLSDTTGTRRFLPIEIDLIDLEAAKAFDKGLMYAQAYALFNQGFRFWFDKQEIDLINQRNERFGTASVEGGLMQTYFEKPDSEEGGEYMTVSEIAIYLATKAAWYRPSNRSLQEIGKVFRKLNYDRVKKRRGKDISYCFLVKKVLSEPLPEETIPSVF